MGKKKCKPTECPAGEKWAVPYADFLSLLLALFIALYALASVNTEKMKALKEEFVKIYDYSAKPEEANPVIRMNAKSGDSELESISQFFHILGSVDQQRGCCEVADGKYEITLYTSCCNASKGIYYYTTYENHQIQAVDMYREDLDGDTLRRYPLINEEQIRVVN